MEKNKSAMSQVQRVVALRIARCYRTVSDMATLVLARMPPTYPLAEERTRIRTRKQLVSQEQGVTAAMDIRHERAATLWSWQQIWERTHKAVWIRKMVPDLKR